MRLELAKANHARAGAEIRLRWDEDAHLLVADASPAEGGVVAAIRDRVEAESILAAMRACAAAEIAVPAARQGYRTGYQVLSAQAALAESLRRDDPAVRRRFWTLMEHLRAIGAVREVEMRASHRHSIVVLTLVSEGERAFAHSEASNVRR
jgi:hypothetical protein